jgi:hypothetical protein
MVFDRPVFVANVFKSCFAREVGVSVMEIDVLSALVVGTETFASGVGARGMKEELRDGVNGADVGIMRDCGFAVGSSRITGVGWACGNSNPGGTEGVDDLDILLNGKRRPKSSAALSATRASTDSVASSRGGRP